MSEEEHSWPRPAAIRSRFVLEMAAAMCAAPGEPYREAEVCLQRDGGKGSLVTVSATSTVDNLTRVANREIDFSFINPSSALTVAYNGKGSHFTAPQPIRALAVLPSPDQCLIAVSESTGLTCIEDIARAKAPLRISVRGTETHWLHCMIEDIFRAAGFSGRELLSWGGALRKEGKIPDPGDRKFQAMARGEIDAIFDEGAMRWGEAATQAGMRVLGMSEETAARLEAIGYRRTVLRRADYPLLPEDVLTLDFSGWPLFVHANADAATVTAACAGLEARRASIPWEGDGPLPLAIMCGGGEGAPLDVPLHPAAEKFWKDGGYL